MKPSKRKQPTATPQNLPTRASQILRTLKATYPNAHCELAYQNPFQLLIATILSAQCTDKRVNLVTPQLFEAYPTPKEMASAPLAQIESIIRSTGFYHNKAKNIQAASQAIETHHNGQVPQTMQKLASLPGVGRKTANVVLGNAFGFNIGIVVDTHVSRLAQRLGLTSQKQPERIESELMPLFPKKDWTLLSHLLIWHGRRRCIARKPDCSNCELRTICPSASSTEQDKPISR